jgi:hypothetical protein
MFDRRDLLCGGKLIISIDAEHVVELGMNSIIADSIELLELSDCI